MTDSKGRSSSESNDHGAYLIVLWYQWVYVLSCLQMLGRMKETWHEGSTDSFSANPDAMPRSAYLINPTDQITATVHLHLPLSITSGGQWFKGAKV